MWTVKFLAHENNNNTNVSWLGIEPAHFNKHTCPGPCGFAVVCMLAYTLTPLDPHVAMIKGLLVGGNFCRHDLPVASLIWDNSFRITACYWWLNNNQLCTHTYFKGFFSRASWLGLQPSLLILHDVTITGVITEIGWLCDQYHKCTTHTHIYAFCMAMLTFGLSM